MSRIGKKIITIPSGVTLDVKKISVIVKGPKGELVFKLHPHVSVVLENNEATVKVSNENNTEDRALWGTTASILRNMVSGVASGFKRQLEINGVGYKAAMKGENLILEVGFSNPVEVKPLSGVKLAVEKNIITVEGPDKQVVGEMAANIRRVRKPEPYKGKGIKYIEEILRRKEGKTAAKSA
ncbi:MAG: 50S ribosomal protein L6 [bacterium]